MMASPRHRPQGTRGSSPSRKDHHTPRGERRAQKVTSSAAPVPPLVEAWASDNVDSSKRYQSNGSGGRHRSAHRSGSRTHRSSSHSRRHSPRKHEERQGKPQTSREKKVQGGGETPHLSKLVGSERFFHPKYFDDVPLAHEEFTKQERGAVMQTSTSLAFESPRRKDYQEVRLPTRNRSRDVTDAFRQTRTNHLAKTGEATTSSRTFRSPRMKDYPEHVRKISTKSNVYLGPSMPIDNFEKAQWYKSTSSVDYVATPGRRKHELFEFVDRTHSTVPLDHQTKGGPSAHVMDRFVTTSSLAYPQYKLETKVNEVERWKSVVPLKHDEKVIGQYASVSSTSFLPPRNGQYATPREVEGWRSSIPVLCDKQMRKSLDRYVTSTSRQFQNPRDVPYNT